MSTASGSHSLLAGRHCLWRSLFVSREALPREAFEEIGRGGWGWRFDCPVERGCLRRVLSQHDKGPVGVLVQHDKGRLGPVGVFEQHDRGRLVYEHALPGSNFPNEYGAYVPMRFSMDLIHDSTLKRLPKEIPP
eukprot:282448-Chlamydomonas_euryale.AAC.1